MLYTKSSSLTCGQLVRQNTILKQDRNARIHGCCEFKIIIIIIIIITIIFKKNIIIILIIIIIIIIIHLQSTLFPGATCTILENLNPHLSLSNEVASSNFEKLNIFSV